MTLAFCHLSKAEIGLWIVLNQVVGYLVWLDLGVGDGLGRKIAPALAAGNNREASSWWTASWGLLLIQGVVVILISTCCHSQILSFLKIPTLLLQDAKWLFLSTSFLLALNLPCRMYPGILIAQERFHWVPIIQSVIPWIQITVFACMLWNGHGIRSYIWATAACQLSAFAAFLILVHCQKSGNLRLRFTCLHWDCVRNLLNFGGSMTILGLTSAITGSLPALIIGRQAGFAAVPPFGFTQRGPAMLSNLVLRTSLSFYPALQRMKVEGRHKEFLSKYCRVLDLTLAVGLMGAGAIIAFNRALIETIASPLFFAGHWANALFATGLILGPLCACLMHLLQYSASPGKVAWLSILQLVLFVSFGSFIWQRFGLPGMTALLVLLPLITTAPYAMVHGARECGFSAIEILLPAIARAAVMVAAVLTCGLIVTRGAPPTLNFISFGRAWFMPSPTEVVCVCTLVAGAGFLFWISFKKLKNITRTNL